MPYLSKLLLFGEHTINRGSDALAIPYPAFAGDWAYSADFSPQQNLSAFATHLEILQQAGSLLASLDLDAFQSALSKGLYFNSTIPVGYGLGSSGALCAAVYDRFCPIKIERMDRRRFPELKQALAQIESFFHGSSSGTDPLICYLNQPILLKSEGTIEIVDLPKSSELTFFLLDTLLPRSTGPLVQFFLQSCEEAAFFDKVTTQLVWHTNKAIAAFLKADWKDLFENTMEISRFQMEELSNMTPLAFHGVWKAGLQSDLYCLKMCGAGGGGFTLGVTFDWKKTKEQLSDYSLRKIGE